MFTLELDLILAYIPPMSDDGGGIHLTRTLSLPFAPYNGLRVFSREIDHCPDPEGFALQDVVWDLDREVFLAHAESVSQGLPIGEIPADIRSWIEKGWRLGSYSDWYEEADGEKAAPAANEGEDGDDYT